MDRFYKDAIKAMNDGGLIEMRKDVEQYVNMLLLEKAALISELSIANTPRGNNFLKRFVERNPC